MTARLAGRIRGGYVESNLLRDETVVYWARLHWFIFVAPCLFLGLGLAMFIGILIIGIKDAVPVAFLLGGGIGSFGVLLLGNRYINYISAEFAVTTKRVIMKTGFIRRRTLELLHNKIDALSVDQSILGRVFNFGSVGVAVATEKQHFPFVSKPLEFRRQVQSRQV